MTLKELKERAVTLEKLVTKSTVTPVTKINSNGEYQTNLIYCDFSTDTEFELSDTVAEELISLAVTMAAEIVESLRLATKMQTMQLEQ